jgi:hypothetical protein
MFASMIGLVSAGCVMTDPGGQVKKAMTQEQRVGWHENGAFDQYAIGTHTNDMVMAEGHIVLMIDPDGNEIIDHSKSTLTHYLRTSPGLEDTGNALGLMAKASTEQSKVFMDGFNAIVGMLVPLVRARAADPVGEPEASPAANGDAIRELIRDEVRKAIERTP